MTRDTADKIMSTIDCKGYATSNPGTINEIAVYRYKPEVPSDDDNQVEVRIRLRDDAYQFCYRVRNKKHATHFIIETDYFVPITKKKKFMSLFDDFKSKMRAIEEIYS